MVVTTPTVCLQLFWEEKKKNVINHWPDGSILMDFSELYKSCWPISHLESLVHFYSKKNDGKGMICSVLNYACGFYGDINSFQRRILLPLMINLFFSNVVPESLFWEHSCTYLTVENRYHYWTLQKTPCEICFDQTFRPTFKQSFNCGTYSSLQREKLPAPACSNDADVVSLIPFVPQNGKTLGPQKSLGV